MGFVQINTQEVLSAATQIDTDNKQLQEGLTDLEHVMRTVWQNWEGDAARASAGKYETIKHNFAEPRYSVVDSFARFLRNRVGEAYSSMEQAIARAAAAFK